MCDAIPFAFSPRDKSTSASVSRLLKSKRKAKRVMIEREYPRAKSPFMIPDQKKG